jgi:hypothetical protein
MNGRRIILNGRRIILTVAAALALVAGGTAAGAAIAGGPVDSSGVVHGCYTTNANKGSHFFRLQDSGTSCPRGTTAIMWNQQGPQGPQGAAGPQGPAGTSGWSGQVQFTTDPQDADIASVEILSQAGPSILSATVDPDNPDAIIFTGDNLPTKMFPIAVSAYNTSVGPVYVGNTVANTSFQIFFIGEPLQDWNQTGNFSYFLPSS